MRCGLGRRDVSTLLESKGIDMGDVETAMGLNFEREGWID